MTPITPERLEELEARIRELLPELMELSFGCEILWTYTHHLNSKSTTEITKRGCIFEEPNSMNQVLVKLRGNKNLKKIHQNRIGVLGHPITLEHCRVALRRALEHQKPPLQSFKAVDIIMDFSYTWLDLKPFSEQHEVHLFLAPYLL